MRQLPKVNKGQGMNEILKINKICRANQTENSALSCVHNDSEKKLILYQKIKINDQFYVFERVIKFCPICGYSYQPERLNPGNADNGVCDSLNTTNK